LVVRLQIKGDDPLPEGSGKAILKTTTLGERIPWLFGVPEHNDVEVAGFTSLSDSAQANAYVWTTALNGEIHSITA
jgi:hypothetical protein